ncbi:MAG: methylmalonyl-CoA epimerase, partial [Sphingobacteriales bacterium]
AVNLAIKGVFEAYAVKGNHIITVITEHKAVLDTCAHLEKKGEGIHHIAFEVEDIYAEIERLKTLGFILINPEPKRGADNKLICFLHPKTTNGVLVELCMEIK